MVPVTPKKCFDQHFLIDKNIAEKITRSLTCKGYDQVIEIGPGTGILTKLLLENKNINTRHIEIDRESVQYLKKRFPGSSDKIIEQDFLKYSLGENHSSALAIIGNLPYSISSQIFFKLLDNWPLVAEVVCMMQKEVAERIVSPPGSKAYGILSVLVQAFYNTQYLFSVGPRVFIPPPNVESAVIRLRRRSDFKLECNEELFFKVVKTAFGQRRKMLRNSLSPFIKGREEINYILPGNPEKPKSPAEHLSGNTDRLFTGRSEKFRQRADKEPDPVQMLLADRPEQLSVEDFVILVRYIESLS